MKVYFVRHGETDWNKAGRLQGRTDIPLNENGRRVAELTREGLKGVAFDTAFTSPLVRARETAEIILEGRGIEIQDEERVIEVAFGKYEGAKKNEADENIEYFFRKPECYRAKDGLESIEEIFAREKAFLEELFHDEKYKESTILVATHGAALSGIICVLKGYEVKDFWKDGLHKNCGMTIVEVTDGKPTILQQGIILYEEDAVANPTWVDKK
ncbi:MAG: histidine phosphatase family protein [Tyzzerella sp.]|nr:histidine phosphatase family protein [Tyzzerella sp.]